MGLPHPIKQLLLKQCAFSDHIWRDSTPRREGGKEADQTKMKKK